jgi:hypothetical protein
VSSRGIRARCGPLGACSFSLLALLVSGLVPCAAQQPADVPYEAPSEADVPSPDASVFRKLKVFDFDERPLGNFEDTPMFWQRFEGPGLPFYSRGQFDDGVGHAAPPSFHFELQGGNIGYEYGYTDLVIFPDSDYLLEGYVRVDELNHAAALVVCYLVDRHGERVEGSTRVSRRVNSDTGPDGEWQRVVITLPGDFPDARALRVQLWVLQDYVWFDPDGPRVDPIIRQDVRADVWFDDVLIYRMPRLRFQLDHPGSVVPAGEESAVDVEVHNATLATARVRLRVHDEHDEIELEHGFEVPPQTTEAERVSLPDLPPGLYDIRVVLWAGDELIFERTTRFAVLPPMPPIEWREPDHGVDIGRWRYSNEEGALALVTELGCGAAKVGLPLSPIPAGSTTAEYFRQARDLSRRLAMRQIRTTGVITNPAATDDSDDRFATWRMVAADERWLERASAVFAYFGGYLLSWQMGYEAVELGGGGGWTGEAVQRLREDVERFIAAPELILPRSVLDMPAASYLTGEDPGGPVEPTPGPGTGPLFAYSFWMPASIPARAFPWQLSFWFEPERDPVLAATLASSADTLRWPERWLTIGAPSDAGLTPDERVADMAHRIILARAVNPDRLYVPAPFELTHEGGPPGWQPTDAYIPVRTLVHHLNGQTATHTLQIEPNVVAILFERFGKYSLFIWSWGHGSPAQTVDLYAGRHAQALELSGRRRRLERDGASVRVPLTRMPLILTDVDAALLLLQASFTVAPHSLQIHDPLPRPVLMLENYYDEELAAMIELTAPRQWEVAPNPIPVRLAPGERLAEKLFFTIPPRQLATAKHLGVDVHMRRPHAVDLHFDVTLEIELHGLDVHGIAWWRGNDLVVEQTLHNLSQQTVSFTAFCQAPSRPQLEGVFLEVPPGEVRAQRYLITGARGLRGGQLWMGIQEIDGRRMLDQLVPIPD